MKALLVLIIALISPAALAATVVSEVRLVDSAEGARVVVNLSQPTPHTSFMLDNPPRLVVDIPNARLAQPGRRIDLGSADIRSVRTGIRNGTDLRLVVDLAALVNNRTFLESEGGHRLVVQLYRAGEASGVSAAPGGGTAVRRQPAPRGDLVVVIDPGHGGRDPGAIGPGGTREKDVVLQISRRLRDLIDAEPGMRAVMTRDRDVFLPLRSRVEVARRNRADMFISVHADAIDHANARGSSVYVLSTKVASSEAARLLAQRENAADLIGGVAIAHREQDVASLLLDLTQDATLEASIVLADLILREMSKVGEVHKALTERAGFAVLKAPDIPSVLVETAFISNPGEERKLRDSAHQQRLAQAMMNGVRAYFQARPAHGVLVQAELSAPPGETAAAPTAAPETAPAPLPQMTVRADTPVAGAVVEPQLPPPQLIARSMGVAEAPPVVAGPPVPAIPVAALPQAQVHVIQRGESLADIARRYRVSLSSLQAANGLNANRLRMPAGTQLMIPVGDS